MKSAVEIIALICICSAVSGISGQNPNPCDSLPGGTGFVNDYRHCEAYFSCIGGLPFEVRCPDGLHFDPINLWCDLPQLVDCPNCPATGVSTFPHPSSCTKWTLCVNGFEVPQECASGTRFNPNIGTCDLEENVRCARDTCESLEDGTGIAPSPDSCKDYFYCYRGTKVMVGTCSTGLSFDVTTNRCVRRGSGKCFPGTSI